MSALEALDTAMLELYFARYPANIPCSTIKVIKFDIKTHIVHA
jgi:hypothetical protein